jgi:hypothetical protein
MFIGHYAPVLAIAAVRRSPSLAAGFVAVQLVDVGFFSLSYFGIEKWALNPSLTGFMPVDLYYMPYTHSLVGSTAWALGAGLLTALLTPAGRKFVDGLIIALLVLSHWFLDLIVHRHDLPLVHDAGEKLGYGLWDHPAAVVPLELGLFFAGFALFMAATKPRGVMGWVVPWIVVAMLLAVQGFNWFTPPTNDPVAFSAMGLGVYFALAGLAWWLDSVRAKRAAPADNSAFTMTPAESSDGLGAQRHGL